jgi:hypothetical protein
VYEYWLHFGQKGVAPPRRSKAFVARLMALLEYDFTVRRSMR